MKKILALILVVFTFTALFCVSAVRGNVQKTLYYNGIKITLDGNAVIPHDANGTYVEPFIIDGTTYLPVRAVAKTVGLNVGWDGETNTVILSDEGFTNSVPVPEAVPLYGYVEKTLVYTDIKITVNGASLVPKDANGNYVESFIIDGTTYLPVRAVASFLGLGVEWDGSTNTVILSSKKKTPVTWSLENGVLTVSGEGKMEEIFKIMYHTSYDIYGNPNPTRPVFHSPWEKRYEQIKEVRISEGITDITADAFSGCTNLTHVTIPSSVRTIGMHAFSDTGLLSVTLPEGLGQLNYGVFLRCASLTDIYIPSSVAEIPFDTFWNCKQLQKITVSDDNPYFCDVDGVLFTKDMSELIYYPIGRPGDSYTVPEGVSIIGDSSFNLCKLKKISLPDSVTEIKANAFYQANKIEEFDMSENVRDIGEFAFADCQSLKSIVIPEGVTRISGFCFNSCIKLREIVIPDSVTEIEARAFQSCVFNTINIPKNLKAIGSSAFSDCWYLNMDLEFPETLEIIADYAFTSCKRIKDVKLGKNVSVVGDAAFSSCEKAVISVDSDNPYLVTDADGALYTKDMKKLLWYPLNNGKKQYSVPEGVAEIGRAVFPGTSVETVKLPVSLEKINAAAFSGGCNVKVIHYPGTPEQYADIEVEEGNILDYLDVYLNWGSSDFCILCGGTDHTEHTKEMGVKWNISLDVLMVGGFGRMSDLLTISGDRVNDPEWLEKAKDNVVAVSVNGEVKDVCFKAFAGLDKLTNVSLCDGIESIGAVAFADNPLLEVVAIPKSVKDIGAEAFRNCTSLVEAVIPEKVTVIMPGLFRNCSSLKAVMIPGNIAIVGDGVFEGCDSLEVIYFNGTREKWNRLANSFGGDIEGVKVVCNDY